MLIFKTNQDTFKVNKVTFEPQIDLKLSFNMLENLITVYLLFDSY